MVKVAGKPQKQAEPSREQYRQSQEYFGLLIEHLPIALIVWDREFRVQRWNPAAEKIFGFTTEEALGKHPYDIIVSREAQPHVDNIWRRLLEGTTTHSVNENVTKQGRTILCSWTNTPLKQADGTVFGVLSTVQDITELKRVETALKASEERFRGLVENIPVGIAIITPDGRAIERNKALQQMYGYSSKEELMKSPALAHFYDPEEGKRWLGLVERGLTTEFEALLKRRDGTTFWASFVAIPWASESGERWLINVIHDITKHKQSEEALQKAAQEWRTTFDSITDFVSIHDKDFRFVRVNKAVAGLFYKKPKELIGKHCYELFHGTKGAAPNCPHERVLTTKEPSTAEFFEPHLGIHLEVSIAPIFNEKGEVMGTVHIVRDVSRRKGMEEQVKHRLVMEEAISRASRLLASQVEADLNEMLRILGEAVVANRAHIFQFRDNGRIWDNTYEWCAPVTEPQIGNLQGRDSAVFPWWRKKLEADDCIVIPDVNAMPSEAAAEQGSLQAQNIRSLLVVPIRSAAGTLAGFMGFDDTEKCRQWTPEDLLALQVVARTVAGYWERRQSREELQKSEEKYSTLVERGNDGIIIIQDGLIKFANLRLVEMTGFSLEEALDKLFLDFVTPGYRASVADYYKKRVSGEQVPSNYEMEIMAKGGQQIPVEISASRIEYQGRVADMAIVRDITERRQSAAEIKQNVEKLQRALDGAVLALASLAEKRDPYTAGHQRRVAALAVAIAREMGLSGENLDAIRIAGTLHDIGKIYVPAEILSKPSGLTEVELSIIRTHSQVGYDILKTVEFPWPVAQIVQQHHEKMDGSGYPSGISGKDILLEARILGVADVVEAMSSHRPYRAALGIEQALEEISQSKGVFYDPAVVDACLRLFTEKRFQFE